MWKKKKKHLFVFLDHNLDNDILELDIQHGCHSLLLGSHQRGAEDHSHVGGCHSVVFAVTAHAVNKHRVEVENKAQPKCSLNTKKRSRDHFFNHSKVNQTCDLVLTVLGKKK